MKWKPVLMWALFLAIDFFIAVGIGEVWVRLFVPVENICYSVHEKIGTIQCANQKTYGYVEDGYANVAITNSIGSHDVEREKVGRKGSCRIQIYGDSILSGMGVPLERTIPMLLEQDLKSYALDVEILNMGLGTESTAAQLTAYEEIGREYDANLVACMFMDDFGDNVRELSGNVHAPYFKLNEDGQLTYFPPVPKDTRNFVSQFKRRWSLLYRLIANKVIESKLYFQCKEWKARLAYDLHLMTSREETAARGAIQYEAMRKALYLQEAWPVTLRLIERFAEVSERDGRDFVLIDTRRFDDNVGTVHTNKDLGAFCKRNGIAYIPLFEMYDKISSGESRKTYFLLDGHPNVEGNRRISQYLAEELISLMREKRAVQGGNLSKSISACTGRATCKE